MSFKKNDYLKELSELFPTNNFYKFANEIPEKLNTRDKIPVWCNIHNVKFYKKIMTIKHRHTCNCRECANKILSNVSSRQEKYTIEKQIAVWKERFKDNISYDHVDLSIGSNFEEKTKILLTCPTHR